MIPRGTGAGEGPHLGRECVAWAVQLLAVLVGGVGARARRDLTARVDLDEQRLQPVVGDAFAAAAGQPRRAGEERPHG